MAAVVKTFIAVALLSFSLVLTYKAPDDCDWSLVEDGSGDGVELFCHLSAINSDLEKTNFSVIPSEGLAKLYVKCNKSNQGQLSRDAFSTLSQLQELHIDGCRVQELPPFAFEGLSDLKKLSIATQQPTSVTVQQNSLAGLPELAHLDLSQNGIRSLPKDELCRLTKLSHLSLHQNELKSIDDLGVGNCLKNLKKIDLSENKISFLKTSHLSQNFPALETLHLNNNFIRFVLPDEVSPNATTGCSLRTVNLSNNQISSFPPMALISCKSLTKLTLANNSLAILEQETFDGLTSLEVLDLSGNLLQSSQLQSRLFRDLGSLIELILSRNQVETIDDFLSSFALNLNILRLDHNSLTTIPSKIFNSMTKLKELDLSNNKIHKIESNCFKELSSLTHLLLSHNEIDSLDEDAFKENSNLLVLDLSKNNFQSAPSSLLHLDSLQTLDLSENMLKSIENASFLQLKQLWRVQLHGNRITNITEDLLRQLLVLQILDLSSNLISVVEKGSFDLNQHLQALRLDNNYLSTLDGLFNNLSNLKWLNISSNNLTEFDYSNIPVQLHWLDISHNKITDLGNQFGSASLLQLAEMDVSFNQVELLGPHNLPDSIETLLANDNKVSHIIPYTFLKKSKLSKVDLSVNSLTTIDKNSLRLSFESQKKADFYVTGNPIDCDCHMMWFKSINSPDAPYKYPWVKDIESIYCKQVYSYEETFVPLVEAANEDFLCPYATHCFSLCQCCDFDACDCEMMCPDNCTCYHDSLWSRNIAVCSNAGLEDLPRKLPMDATEIFLDGNFLPELNSHMFIGRKNLKVLHLNDSRIHTIQNRTFNGLGSLSRLFLQDNLLNSLQGYEFEALVNLKELHLENNLIENVNNLSFQFLSSLEILHLQGNRITHFQVWQLGQNPSLVNLRLAGNPWSCKCEFLGKFSSWVKGHSKMVRDEGSLTCEGLAKITSASMSCEDVSQGSNGHLTRVQEFVVSESYLPLMAATLSTFAVILLIFFVAFVYRKTLRVWIHSKYGVRVFDALEKSEKCLENFNEGKIFDVFVTYNNTDDNFVRRFLAEELERPELRYQTCLFHRDFNTSSPYLDDTLVRAAEASRRTILVLSKNFIELEWSCFEYRSAFHQAIRSNKAKLIIIIMENIPDQKIDSDLKLYLKTSLVIHRRDKLFWQKLRYSLPDVPLAENPTKQHLLDQMTTSSMSAGSSYSSACSIAAIMSTNVNAHSRISPSSVSSNLSMSPVSSLSISGSGNNNHNGSQNYPGAFQTSGCHFYNKSDGYEHTMHI